MKSLIAGHLHAVNSAISYANPNALLATDEKADLHGWNFKSPSGSDASQA